VLLLHGAGGAGPWRVFHDALASRFSLIVPDHPGFGQTDRPDWLEGVDDVVFHYLDLLPQLGLARASVIGMSLGGWIAAELAVAHPELVDRLVLVDPAGLKQSGMELPDLFAITEEENTRLIFQDQALADEELARPVPPGALLQRIKNQTTFARLAWNPYLYSLKLGRRLYRVTCPTLLIWGKEDRVIPAANAQLWLDKLPDARLALIENCGHVPHRERTDEFVRLTVDFLEPALG
jgi:pimeloyl-ACP methyl ester carboxylesterase